MGRLSTLEEQCRAHGVLAVYLFGSRVSDGMRALAGEALGPAGSDLDVGVVFLGRDADVAALPSLQVAIEDACAPSTYRRAITPGVIFCLAPQAAAIRAW